MSDNAENTITVEDRNGNALAVGDRVTAPDYGYGPDAVWTIVENPFAPGEGVARVARPGLLDGDGEVKVRREGASVKAFVRPSRLEKVGAEEPGAEALGNPATDDGGRLRLELEELRDELDRTKRDLTQARQERDQALDGPRELAEVGQLTDLLRRAVRGTTANPDVHVTAIEHDDGGQAELTLTFPGARWDGRTLVPDTRDYRVTGTIMVEVEVEVTVEATSEEEAHDEAVAVFDSEELSVSSYVGEVLGTHEGRLDVDTVEEA